MRNTQTTAHLPRAYSTSHAQKALNRIRVIRVYVRFRAHVTVFCLGDGECRSAFDGPKPLITRRCQRNSVHGPCDQKINSAPTTDRETVWRRAFWSFFYLHDSNGAQIGSDARNNAKQADDVVQDLGTSRKPAAFDNADGPIWTVGEKGFLHHPKKFQEVARPTKAFFRASLT